MPNANADTIGSDLLETDGAIAFYVFGRDTPQTRRRSRALMLEVLPIETRLPSFLMGGRRCSRKSLIDSWLSECHEREQARARAEAEAKAAAKAADEARYQRRIGRPRRAAAESAITAATHA